MSALRAVVALCCAPALASAPNLAVVWESEEFIANMRASLTTTWELVPLTHENIGCSALCLSSSLELSREDVEALGPIVWIQCDLVQIQEWLRNHRNIIYLN